jgi:hypothetical protein
MPRSATLATGGAGECDEAVIFMPAESRSPPIGRLQRVKDSRSWLLASKF